MKKLTNLVKKEILNVESLMKIKGAAAGQGVPLCASVKCDYLACTSNANCIGSACTAMSCEIGANGAIK